MKPATHGGTMVINERFRQIELERYTREHDRNCHSDGQLVEAAIAYLIRPLRKNDDKVPYIWPWEYASFKPSPNDRIRELVKAAALIVAEIDRLEGPTE